MQFGGDFPPNTFHLCLLNVGMEAMEGGGGLSVYSDRKRGVITVTWGCRNGAGLTAKGFQKRVSNGRRVRRKLKGGGCMKIIV